MFYSLKNRLIAIFVLLLVLSSGTLSYFLFNESRLIIRSYIESSALEKMDQYGSFIDMALLQIYDFSSLVFNSDMVDKWDAAISDPALPDGKKMLSNIQLSTFLTQTTNNYSGVSSVSIYRNNGLRVGTDNQVAMHPEFRKETWYADFVKYGSRWVSAHSDPFELYRERNSVVSLLLPIGSFEPSLTRNVMKINVSSNFFLEPLKRIHLGESGTIYLLDQDGRPVLEQPDFKLHGRADRQVELIRQNPFASEGVVYLSNENNQTDILVFKKLKVNNWLLVGIVPEEDLYAKFIDLRNTVIVFSSLLLIAAILAAIWLSHGISKPLSRLAMAMRSVQKGDFAAAEKRIPAQDSVRNEVGYVTATFRNMVLQLKHHIKTEFELKLLRQQAEYKALLMQINPHFLFNTLELLSSLAIQRRTEDTVSIIGSLGKMLRFSLRTDDDIIPLPDEIKYLEHYVSILQIRFRDRLIYVRHRRGAGQTFDR
jgi:two-component system sensor histidine kinase YesM